MKRRGNGVGGWSKNNPYLQAHALHALQPPAPPACAGRSHKGGRTTSSSTRRRSIRASWHSGAPRAPPPLPPVLTGHVSSLPPVLTGHVSSLPGAAGDSRTRAPRLVRAAPRLLRGAPPRPPAALRPLRHRSWGTGETLQDKNKFRSPPCPRLPATAVSAETAADGRSFPQVSPAATHMAYALALVLGLMLAAVVNATSRVTQPPACAPPPAPPPLLRTNRTRRVLHPVLIRHAAWVVGHGGTGRSGGRRRPCSCERRSTARRATRPPARIGAGPVRQRHVS